MSDMTKQMPEIVCLPYRGTKQITTSCSMASMAARRHGAAVVRRLHYGSMLDNEMQCRSVIDLLDYSPIQCRGAMQASSWSRCGRGHRWCPF